MSDPNCMNSPLLILVPTDFSDSAEQALRCAIDLAAKLGARLAIVHAWSDPIPVSEGGLGVPAELRESFAQSARAQLELRVNRARNTGVSAEGVFRVGEPCRIVCFEAQSLKAGLVVMGTHGTNAFLNLLLGSVAQYVLRHAPCPVLMVRPGVCAASQDTPPSTAA